jgi:hypothetical protein
MGSYVDNNAAAAAGAEAATKRAEDIAIVVECIILRHRDVLAPIRREHDSKLAALKKRLGAISTLQEGLSEGECDMGCRR